MQARPKGNSGSALVDVIVFAGIIVFVVIPVFSGVIQAYSIVCKSQILRDSVDMANVSSYNTLHGRMLGKSDVCIEDEELEQIWRSHLAINLNLGLDLEPQQGSIIDGRAELVELQACVSDLPVVCSRGVTLTRPSVHSVVSFPVRPMLMGRMIMRLTGEEFICLVIHVDSEIPVNN